LRQYVEDGSEEAFAELVNHHANLVYSAALRQVHGNIHLAQDLTQSVFTDLARKAGRLARHKSLAGWLYTSVRFAAGNLRRETLRRERREQSADSIREMSAPSNLPASSSESDRLASLLDEAMHTLREQDRHAIILRFFQDKPFARVGESLGLNENAARKRVERALVKLRSVFARHGITISTVALPEMLAGQAVSAAPADLAALVAKGALIGASAIPPLVPIFFKFMSITKCGLIALVTASLTTGLVVQTKRNNKLRDENRRLQQQLNEPAETPGPAPSAPNRLSQDQLNELLRLRGEVGVLKSELVQARRVQPKAAPFPEQKPAPPWADQPENQPAILKMGYAKVWMGALFRYARENDGRFPTNFTQAANFLAASLQNAVNPGNAVPDLANFQEATNHFEIVYQGSLNDVADWAKAIVVREKEPWPSPDGGWSRTYAFADGHSEIHRAEDGNFAPWEEKHDPRKTGL